jgi:signal peptidase I
MGYMMRIILMYAVLMVVSISLYIFCIHRGATWAGGMRGSVWRAVVAWIIFITGSVIIAMFAGSRFVLYGASDAAAHGALFSIISTVFSAIFTFVLIVISIGLTYRRGIKTSIKGALLPLSAILITGLVTRFLFNPYVAESFVASTNSMSPAIRPVHYQSACISCGQGEVIVGAYNFNVDRISNTPAEKAAGICSNCLKHVATTWSLKPVMYGADHFIVDKTVLPARWDIAAYRNQQGVLHVSRVVGLPGERIQLAEGHVQINGKVLQTPSNIGAVEYGQTAATSLRTVGVQQAVTLSNSEYFLASDNQAQAMDSRFVGPINFKNILGVVSCRFWPLNRIYVFR